MDEADDHFDEGLEFPWYAAGRFLSNATEDDNTPPFDLEGGSGDDDLDKLLDL